MNTASAQRAEAAQGPASGFAWPDAAPAALPQDSTFGRLWRGFATARVAISVALLLLLVTLITLGPTLHISRWLAGMCAAYFAAALAARVFMRPLPPGKAFHPQWASTVGIDLAVFATLQFVQAGGINYSPLFALPLLMASVMGSALLAFATAAVVTLLLLAEAWFMVAQGLTESAPRFLQAGLASGGYFALAFLANQLAARLAREEKTARRSQKVARMQAQVNELVIETFTDGVLVIDSSGDVHAANPAAREMLGCSASQALPFALASRPHWRALLQLGQSTFAKASAQTAEAAVEDGSPQSRRMLVRTRLTAPQGAAGESLCVIFLEDLREMEARLRTEKLAAMGRMSAAVAHEIRNPLAAITQANALLEEDLKDAGHRQLSALVRQNARRLAQIVEDVLNISRVQHTHANPAAAPLELDASVGGTCADWTGQTGSAGRITLKLEAGAARVAFETDPLRRVLVNLLDNALRYAGNRADSIQVVTLAGRPRAQLSVWSDGAPLERTVQRHLFEPFFSSESRSSGLGLYICRELCERHGATIGYRREHDPATRSREGNEFFVSFAPLADAVAAPPAFDTMRS